MGHKNTDGRLFWSLNRGELQPTKRAAPEAATAAAIVFRWVIIFRHTHTSICEYRTKVIWYLFTYVINTPVFNRKTQYFWKYLLLIFTCMFIYLLYYVALRFVVLGNNSFYHTKEKLIPLIKITKIYIFKSSSLSFPHYPYRFPCHLSYKTTFTCKKYQTVSHAFNLGFSKST